MDRILLVEDKAELREMLQTALTRMGYEVSPAAGVGEALALLRQHRFAAALTDLKLPAGSGMDVLRAALEADPAMPVVIMTAYGGIADAVAAMRDGAYDFIQKPIKRESLLPRVELARTMALGVGLAAVFALGRVVISLSPPLRETYYDEALTGLMSLQILRGVPQVFYWGQPYLGAVDAYLAAAAFRVPGLIGERERNGTIGDTVVDK